MKGTPAASILFLSTRLDCDITAQGSLLPRTPLYVKSTTKGLRAAYSRKLTKQKTVQQAALPKRKETRKVFRARTQAASDAKASCDRTTSGFTAIQTIPEPVKLQVITFQGRRHIRIGVRCPPLLSTWVASAHALEWSQKASDALFRNAG